jgi:N6-adenosine-specific RNA methylase IME4
MDQLKRISGEEAGEYQSHTFATNLFGKVDETHPNFIKLRQQIVAEGVIHTPAIEYEGNLIAGRKRARIASLEGFELPVIVFDGTPEDALTRTVSSNTAHSNLAIGAKAITAAYYYEMANLHLGQQLSQEKVSLITGVPDSTLKLAITICNRAKQHGSNGNIVNSISSGMLPLNQVKKLMEMETVSSDKWDEATRSPEDYDRIMREAIDKPDPKITRETVKQTRQEQAKGNGAVYNVIYTEFTDNTANIPFADNCVLYMYVHRTQIANAVWALNEWGLAYRDIISVYSYANKRDLNTPIMNEVIMIAVKGLMMYNPDWFPSIQGNVKERPPVIDEAISKHYPDELKLSMFKTRHECIGTGWDYIGDEQQEDKPNGNGNGKRKRKTKGKESDTIQGDGEQEPIEADQGSQAK